LQILSNIDPVTRDIHVCVSSCVCVPHVTASTESATPPKSAKPRNSDFRSILRYKFKLRFWSDLNLYRGIWVSGLGGFRGCSIFSGKCHMTSIKVDSASGVLQCVAVKCRFRHCRLCGSSCVGCVAVFCSVLRCVVAVCCSVLQSNADSDIASCGLELCEVCCKVLQCVAVC